MDGDVQGGPMGGSRMQDQTGLSSTHIQGTASTESQGVGGATAGGGSGKRELSGGFITAAPAGVQDVMGRRE